MNQQNLAENATIITDQSGDNRCSRRRFLRNAALAGIGLSAIQAMMIPAEASSLFGSPSVDDQKKVGREAAKQILSKYTEVHDGRARHFNQIGRRLVAALPSSDRIWDFNFHVLESKDVNAFALPGGPMFLFTGLYEKVPSDDALAAVTGHEMTHVRKQHWAKAYAQQQQVDLGIAALMTILRANNNVRTLAGLADNAISLKYSRGEEQQADEGGLTNMVSAGYNPMGMIQLFQTLEKVAGNGGLFGTDFLSNHPLTSDRIKHAQNLIADMQDQRNFPPVTPLRYSALVG